MIFALLTISSFLLDLATSNLKEVGDITVREHPYYVTLMKHGQEVCGGALIEANVVVTAASCVSKGLSVKAGATSLCRDGDLNIPAQVIPVKKFRKHPKFNKATNDYDVALLFTADFFSSNVNVKPIELDQSAMGPTEHALAIGLFPPMHPKNVSYCGRMRTQSLLADYGNVVRHLVTNRQLGFTYEDARNAFEKENRGTPVVNRDGKRRLVAILSKQVELNQAIYVTEKVAIVTKVANPEILRFIEDA